MGLKTVSIPKPYSDYMSLKRYLEQQYGSDLIRLHDTKISQAGTAGAVELEEASSETIAQIGKTELTLVLAADTNDNAYDSETVTVHYLDADGDSHEAIATYTEADSTTEVAFYDAETGLVAVTDFYCFDPAYGTLAVVSSVAAQTGDNICIGITGLVAGIADPTLCYAVIAAAATSPVAAKMFGVGSLWGTTKTNQADVGYIETLEYITPWGEIKSANYTVPADGSMPTHFSSLVHTGYYVSDFYRMRDLSLDHTSLDEMLLVSYDEATVYGVIPVGADHAVFTRYMVPADAEAYLAKMCGFVAVNVDLTLVVTYTPYGKVTAVAQSFYLPQLNPFDVEPLIQLEPLTEVSMTIIGNTANLCMDLIILEADADYTNEV